MKRRPLLILALVALSAVLVQAAIVTLADINSPSSPSSGSPGAQDDDTVCTVCGPIRDALPPSSRKADKSAKDVEATTTGDADAASAESGVD